MKRIGPAVGLCLVMLASSSAPASAQATSPATEKFYVNVNVGGQLTSRTLAARAESEVYQETASLASSYPLGKGLVGDVGAGYRIWGDVYAGLLVSVYSKKGDATYSASVPHPLYFDTPLTVNGGLTGLARREVGITPHLTWATTLTDKIDVTVGAGVSIINVSQDLLTGFTVTAGTQDVILGPVKAKGTAIGGYVGGDFIYNLKPRYGVGGYVRYLGGKGDLEANGQTVVEGASAGGLQIGGGVRLRF